MNYIAVDFEWNQAYYTKTQKNDDCLIQLDGEIIQIGAVKMDENFDVTDTFKANIRPVFYRKIHKKVKELTGIDQDKLNSGKDFSSVMEKFIRWCSDEHIFLTWGADDSRILMQNLLMHKFDTSWMGRWINLQVVYAMQNENDGETRQVSLEKAVEKYNIPHFLQSHDAMNDATYTAILCKYLDVSKGIDDYSKDANLSGLKRVACGSYKIVYNCISKQSAFSNKKIKNLTCPYCGEKLIGQKPWIKQSGDRFFTVCHCNRHGLFSGRLKFKREKDGRFTAKYLLYTADKSDEMYYENKLRANADKAKKKRKKRIAEKKTG